MATAQPAIPAAARPGGVTRWVDQAGKISLAGFSYHVGRVFAAELVEAACQQGWSRSAMAGCCWPPTPNAADPTSGQASGRRRSLVGRGPPPWTSR
jgi:hypothetical protein